MSNQEKLEVLSLLQAGRLLLDDPKYWTRNVGARKANGQRIDASSEKAKCWCSAGALLAFGASIDRLVLAAASHLTAAAGGNYIMVNDIEPYAEVLEMWDRAIEAVAREVDS